MRNMFVIALSVMVCVSTAMAVTFTNRGEVISQPTLNDDGPLGSSTVTKDISVWPTQSDRRGLYVATYSFSADGGATCDISSDIPKGTILLEDAVIEVSTAIAPATSTNAIAVGGIEILATGTTLNSTGIKTAVATPGITTSDDEITLTITGDAATAGVFTIYLPVILGNAQ